MKKSGKIFSGDNSRAMWNEIAAITDETTFDALYSLGCKCQELESKVIKLKEKVDAIKAQGETEDAPDEGK